MRISYCERNCSPIYCLKSQFCCYLPSFLRPKDAPNPSSPPNANADSNSNSSLVSISIEDISTEQKFDALIVNNEKSEILNLKSSLKKPNRNRSDSNEEKKGNIKWMDLLGKELVEIKEFEPSECGDSQDDIDGNPPCICTIQ